MHSTGGVLTMDAFQHSFNLNNKSPDFSNLQGNIVSVLQVRFPFPDSKLLKTHVRTGRLLFRRIILVLYQRYFWAQEGFDHR